MLQPEPRKMAAQSRLLQKRSRALPSRRSSHTDCYEGGAWRTSSKAMRKMAMGANTMGEIVTSGNLLIDAQGRHDGHKGKQSVDHGNDDDRFAVAHCIDKEQASQGV
jgi:hypothetical protein